MFLEYSKGVNKIGHIALRVKDLERAKSFYQSLGMKLIWDDDDWCYFETSTFKDGLALLGPNYKAAGPHFAFHFDNKKEVENIHKDLKNAGIHVGSIHEHRDGTASFYMRDTEDNWLEMLYVPKGGIKSNV